MVTIMNWDEQFSQERTRLLATLGEITTGGIIEGIQHIGATSVAGLPAAPCLDIALAVWPFPVEPHRQKALKKLGYKRLPAAGDKTEQRFLHQSGARQLIVWAAGDERWTNARLLRDYLCQDSDARQRYATWKTQSSEQTTTPQAAKAAWLIILLREAQAWWVATQGFAPVHAVTQVLAEFGCPWYISSGWALDLFLGLVTRVHHDVDVVLNRADQLRLRAHLNDQGWQFVTPFQDRLEPWPPHMRIEPPRHQLHAHRAGAFIDFLLTDFGDNCWPYRRDPLILRHARRMSLCTAEGIHYLAPELVLLFKSKNTSQQERSKDQRDFEQVQRQLEPERRAWLRWALIATEPTHPWIAQLG
jgi:GrpB-like predicted nucleotidyltransferase (UPF0157 family)